MTVNIAILVTIISYLVYVIVTVRAASARKKKTALSNLEKVYERYPSQGPDKHGLAHPEPSHDRGA